MEPDALNSALASKRQRRRDLASLPIEEKLRAVVKLQQMAAPILKKRGISRPVWNF
jgi:hypothetical protein